MQTGDDRKGFGLFATQQILPHQERTLHARYLEPLSISRVFCSCFSDACRVFIRLFPHVQLVIEYVGEVIDNDECELRVRTAAGAAGSDDVPVLYHMQMGDGLVRIRLPI